MEIAVFDEFFFHGSRTLVNSANSMSGFQQKFNSVVGELAELIKDSNLHALNYLIYSFRCDHVLMFTNSRRHNLFDSLNVACNIEARL